MASHPPLPIQTGVMPHSSIADASSQWDAVSFFETVYVQYQQRLICVALRILKNQADAEDAVQDSLLRAYSRIKSFRGEASIYTWLVRIVINTSLMTIRKRSRVCPISLDCNDNEGRAWANRLPASGLSAEAVAISRQRQDRMYEAIAGLPLVSKLLILEWVARGLTIAELSDQFEMSVPAVKSCMRRAKERVALRVNLEM